MWPSQQAAEWISDAANFALIASLVIGVIATVLVVWSGNKKEIYLKRDLAAAAARSAEANARASEADARAAQAIERAELEKTARLELESRLADRTIGGENLHRIGTQLASHPGMHVDVIRNDDEESWRFASHLMAVFYVGQWKPRQYYAPPSQYFFERGVFVASAIDASDEEKKASEVLFSAFREIGVVSERVVRVSSFDRSKNMSALVYDGGEVADRPPAPIRVWVGSKPGINAAGSSFRLKSPPEP
jgi:hypothetical protein